MRRYVAVAFLAALGLCASAGAVEFGFDLGTQTGAGWYEDYYGYPVSIRGGAFDLLADVQDLGRVIDPPPPGFGGERS